MNHLTLLLDFYHATEPVNPSKIYHLKKLSISLILFSQIYFFNAIILITFSKFFDF